VVAPLEDEEPRPASPLGLLLLLLLLRYLPVSVADKEQSRVVIERERENEEERQRARMAGGGFVEAGQLKRAHLYEYRITGYFIFACIIAALGGSPFGYDLGISGESFFLSSRLFAWILNVSAAVFRELRSFIRGR